MDVLRLVFFASLFASCARIDYFLEQSIGQISLLTKARDNQVILKDVRISQKDRNKIIKIVQYKDFFYKYWKLPKKGIYTRTTILETKAVGFMVVSSKFNEVKAKDECFPFIGCYPYIGFYKKESALDYMARQENLDYVTWIRPIYAYSTLGYFNDPILSSFFIFDDYELAELVFHELFHTIFFVENELDLNENLANYFGEEVAFEYFKDDTKYTVTRKKLNFSLKRLNSLVVKLAKKLDRLYSIQDCTTKDEAQNILSNFLEEKFIPQIKNECKKLNLNREQCFPLNKKWNNASFAAFLTYENMIDKITLLRSNLKLSLKDFFEYIKGKYDEYKKLTNEMTFSDYLLKPVS